MVRVYVALKGGIKVFGDMPAEVAADFVRQWSEAQKGEIADHIKAIGSDEDARATYVLMSEIAAVSYSLEDNL